MKRAGQPVLFGVGMHSKKTGVQSGRLSVNILSILFKNAKI